MARTISSQVAQASRLFLGALGAPQSDDMVRAVAAWLYQESGGHIVGNNPWNLHSSGGLPGQTGSRYAGPGDKNVAIFATLQAGCTASAMNLVRLAPSYGYGQVIAAARSGNAIAFLDALASSSWSAGHYGGPGPKNKLRKIYADMGGAIPASAAGAATTTSPSSTSGSSGNPIFAAYTEDHILTAADVEQVIANYKPQWIASSGLPEPIAGEEFDRTIAPYMREQLGKYIGQPVSAIPKNTPLGGGIVQDIATAIAGIPAALGDVFTHLAFLLLILAFLGIGAYVVVTKD